MPDFRLPVPEEGKTDKETINNLFDTLIKFRKELQFLLSNLDDKNILSIDAAKIKNLQVDVAYIETLIANQIAANNITVEQLIANEIAAIDIEVSNVTITNVLSANKGYIAELTVDWLETSTKVYNYLHSIPDDVNYIKIKDKEIKFITAQKSGSGTEYVYNRQNQKLYWKDSNHDSMTIDNTGLPVLTYVYTEYVKMDLEFYNDGTNYIPRIVLGTGSGDGDKAKGFVEKIDGGLQFTYVKYDGTEVTLTLGENGISLAGQLNTGVLLNFIDHDFTSADMKGVGTLHVKYNPSSVLASGAQSTAYAFVSGQAVEIAKEASDPVLVSASTNIAGTVVTLTFNKPMANPAEKDAQFAVSNETISAAALNADTKKIDLTLSTTIAYGDTVTVSYTKGTVVSADGGVLQSFSGQSVTNNVSAPVIPDYQPWDNYPDSPLLTALYPYQAIFKASGDTVNIYLIMAPTDAFYVSSMPTITATGDKYLCTLNGDAWSTPVLVTGGVSASPILESNNDIYLDSNRADMYFPKTVGVAPAYQAWTDYPTTPIDTKYYPHQTIVRAGGVTRLFCSTIHKYVYDNAMITTSPSYNGNPVFKYTGGVWVSDGSRYKLWWETLLQTNNDVYTSAQYSTVHFAKTT